MLVFTLLVVVVVLSQIMRSLDQRDHNKRLDELQRRHDERVDRLIAAHADQIAKLTASRDPDLEQLVSLVDRLCQRVQAPAQAVAEHAISTGPQWTPPQPIQPDDDAAFHETKEELADRLAAIELAGGRMIVEAATT